MTEPNQKTVAIDVDGVLASYDGWRGLDHYGEPIAGAVAFTQRLREAGWKIIIHTCRMNRIGQPIPTLGQLIKPLRAFLKQHGFAYDEIWHREGKPIAHAYVDDRAVSAEHNVEGEPDFQGMLYAVERLAGVPVA